MNTLKIETITAFIATDDEGNEGVMAAKGENGWMPMIGADEARIISWLPMAEEMSRVLNIPFRIIQFSSKTDITEEVTSKQQQHE